MSTGAIFFCMEEFIDTSLLYTHFHVRQRSVRVPLCCHLSHSDGMGHGWEGSTSTAVPPTSTTDVRSANAMKQEALLSEQQGTMCHCLIFKCPISFNGIYSPHEGRSFRLMLMTEGQILNVNSEAVLLPVSVTFGTHWILSACSRVCCIMEHLYIETHIYTLYPS